MPTITGELLSGSTDGKPIAVTTSTTIHTCPNGVAGYDEVFILVANVTGVAKTLDLSAGGTICTGVTIPAASPPIPIMTGQRLRNGVVIQASASGGTGLTITGWANRYQK